MGVWGLFFFIVGYARVRNDLSISIVSLEAPLPVWYQSEAVMAAAVLL